MAVTKNKTTGGVPGDAKIQVFELNLGIYATGGVEVNKTVLDVNVIDWSLVAGITGGYVASKNPANDFILIYQDTDPADAGGADIPLTEVANATDLSAETLSLLAAVK